MVAKEAVICDVSWKEKVDVRLDGVGRISVKSRPLTNKETL
jgi:hypothetical protein